MDTDLTLNYPQQTSSSECFALAIKSSISISRLKQFLEDILQYALSVLSKTIRLVQFFFFDLKGVNTYIFAVILGGPPNRRQARYFI